jgi:hypothetical protein
MKYNFLKIKIKDKFENKTFRIKYWGELLNFFFFGLRGPKLLSLTLLIFLV